ncbi:MAG: MFS transporter [Verrucomicrobia bacterium]|nr:MFS transporter [Verrucomicrobiota bacterium]
MHITPNADSSSADAVTRSSPALANDALPAPAAWGNVVLASLLMLATLPGRTQGLGLITEPMLQDLRLDRVDYAALNLWATLLGAVVCLPAGWLMDRWGLRWMASAVSVVLAAVVWRMSAVAGAGGGMFVLLLLTRGLGQSALSVASITTVGKSFGARSGWPMGVYSVLLSVLFAVAFVVVGAGVRSQGWRTTWAQVALGVLVIAVLVAAFLREPPRPAEVARSATPGISLAMALRTSTFWVFAGATALFGLVASGLGLFNEAVLAERGFPQETFHIFLAVTTLCALVGQMLCGWLSLRHPMPRLLAVAMFLYAAGLAALPMIRTSPQLWLFAVPFGVAAGFITVIFFAVWGQAFGRRHLGRIQGAAQMLTVLASALGPLLFAWSHRATGSYAPLLQALAPLVFALGLAAWWTRMSSPGSTPRE